jgi:plastocyanin domain-containing protein
MKRPWVSVAALAGFIGWASCNKTEQAPPSPTKTAAAAAGNRIEMTVTAKGFVPSQTRLKVGQPVTLVVTRTVDKTCATDIVIKDYGINKPLPKDQPVEVTFTPTKAGNIRYACGMDMIAGELVAE